VLFAVLWVWSAASVRLLLRGERPSARLALGGVLLLAALAGDAVPGSGLAALAAAAASLAVLALVALALGVRRVLRRAPRTRWLLGGFGALLAATTLLAAANVAHPPVPLPAPGALPPGEELRALHAADQADRATGRFVLDASRDAARLARVEALDRAGHVATPADRFHAALVLQHGRCPRHFRRAFELANDAARAGVPGADGLRRAAYDRWMLSEGRPQRYGTQVAVSPPGEGECGSDGGRRGGVAGTSSRPR
jgi:hypothetical protein